MQKAEVLILGSGAAGLACALRLAEQGVRSTVVSKTELCSGATLWAQGGISAVLDAADSLESHVADTVEAGGGLCDPELVRRVVARGPACIEWLVERGVVFTPDETGGDGRLHLTREGGHSFRRIVHAADATGAAVATTLADLVLAEPLITVRENAFAVDLIRDAHGKRVVGAYLMDAHSHEVVAEPAAAVVLATGGANMVYLYSSNPSGASGDGIAMAWRAGCRVANMEFMPVSYTHLTLPTIYSV